MRKGRERGRSSFNHYNSSKAIKPLIRTELLRMINNTEKDDVRSAIEKKTINIELMVRSSHFNCKSM